MCGQAVDMHPRVDNLTVSISHASAPPGGFRGFILQAQRAEKHVRSTRWAHGYDENDCTACFCNNYNTTTAQNKAHS